jgi:hypothetical protein
MPVGSDICQHLISFYGIADTVSWNNPGKCHGRTPQLYTGSIAMHKLLVMPKADVEGHAGNYQVM